MSASPTPHCGPTLGAPSRANRNTALARSPPFGAHAPADPFLRLEENHCHVDALAQCARHVATARAQPTCQVLPRPRGTVHALSAELARPTQQQQGVLMGGIARTAVAEGAELTRGAETSKARADHHSQRPVRHVGAAPRARENGRDAEGERCARAQVDGREPLEEGVDGRQGGDGPYALEARRVHVATRFPHRESRAGAAPLVP